MVTEKKCTRCDVMKPLEKFYGQSCGKYGRMSICKACHSKYRNKNKPVPAHIPCPYCGEMFLPLARKKYCTTKCGVSHRYYLKHPEPAKKIPRRSDCSGYFECLDIAARANAETLPCDGCKSFEVFA